jgi:PGF-pre-PGF domain-containing protein
MQKAGYINVTGALTVTGVSPISGSPSGDTPVIITGTGFTDVTGVFFDNIPAKSFVVNGDTEIDAVAPPVPPGAGSSGIVDVTVANSAGSSDIYHADEYQYTPYISGVSPVSGSINGGNTVTITGHNFKDATGVYFSLTGYSSDGIAATQYTIINDNTISAVVPNFGISRNYDVLVTNAAGENYNSPVVTYNTLPVVTEISPNSGPTGGGNTVTITGIGLEDGDAVSFGDKVSPNINVIHGVITAVVPPGSAGTVDVRVMDSWSKLYSPISQPADQYTYTSASSTTSVPSDGIVPTLTTVEADVQTGSSPSVPSTIDIPAQTTVTLPAGATNQISVASASVTPSSNPSETTFSVVPGLAVDADPSGTTFSNPVTISFTVTPAEYASVLTQAGDNPSGITIKYQEPGSTTWTTLQTTVTASGTNYVISAQTIRFCTFAVFSAPVSGGAGSSINAESGSGSSGPSSLDITSPGGTAGQTVTFAIGQSLSGNANYAIETVSIVSSQTLGSTDLTVSDATLVTTPPGNGRITDGVVAIEPVSVNPSAITSGTISFAVSGTWLSQHGLTPQNIVMMRNDGSGWTELPTTFVGQNGNAYTFTATTPGFSYFAITTRLNATAVNATATMSPKVNMTQTYAPAVPTGRIPAPTMSAVSIPTAAPEVTRTTAVPAVTGAGSGSSLPVLIIAGVAGIVVVIGGALLVRRWWIRRQNPALFRDYD